MIFNAEKDKGKLYYNGPITPFFNYTDPQQCLYFFPEPQGHLSFLPTFLAILTSLIFSEFISSLKTIFIFNFFWTLFRKRYEIESDTNPWKATTIEWTETTSPPLGHGNFEKIPSVFRGPYEYSVEGHDKDYCPQTEE